MDGTLTSRLTVLGSCGAWPEPGRACSGFLLEHAGYRVVLDLGYGTLPRLLSALDSVSAEGLDAVIVTHRHPDHAVDLHGLFRARWFGNRGAPPLPLYCPADVLDLARSLEEDDDAIDRVFDWHSLPGTYELGPFILTARSVPHFVPAVGVRLSAPTLTVAYTGDSGPCNELRQLADHADLLIAEASDRNQQVDTPPAPTENALHLDAVEAGRLAATAQSRRLLLTHFWPGNDRTATRAAAAAEFTEQILIADEGLVLSLP